MEVKIINLDAHPVVMEALFRMAELLVAAKTDATLRQDIPDNPDKVLESILCTSMRHLAEDEAAAKEAASVMSRAMN